MSASSWSASLPAPEAGPMSPFSHSSHSSLCQPVHSGSSSFSKSSTRASTATSIVSTRPAMGSMRSQAWRDGA